MSEQELQEQEREAILSIYEGDDAFKELSADTYQYKVSLFIIFRHLASQIVCCYNRYIPREFTLKTLMFRVKGGLV